MVIYRNLLVESNRFCSIVHFFSALIYFAENSTIIVVQLKCLHMIGCTTDDAVVDTIFVSCFRLTDSSIVKKEIQYGKHFTFKKKEKEGNKLKKWNKPENKIPNAKLHNMIDHYIINT
jgi:hypothetical protein